MIKTFRQTRKQFNSDALGVSLLLSVVFLLFLSKQVSALEVIHDTGNTVPIQYGKIRSHTEGANAAALQERTYNPRPLPGRENHFPLGTSLAVGEGVEITVEGLTSPVFIIGLDDISLKWLELNIDVLIDINATGFAVEGSESDFIRIRALLGEMGIPFNIAPGDAVALAYGITSYPALLIQ